MDDGTIAFMGIAWLLLIIGGVTALAFKVSDARKASDARGRHPIPPKLPESTSMPPKQRGEPNKEFEAAAMKWLGPAILARTLAENISKYIKVVQAGELSAPAYKRKVGDMNSSVVEVWNDTRLEVLALLWNHGASDIKLLIQRGEQKRLLDCYIEEKPQLEFPHVPNDDRIHDTVQAMFKVYLCLEEAGRAVLDKETSSNSLFSEFEIAAEKLRVEWTDFENGTYKSDGRSPMPRTVLELMYEDVTKKSKTIALCSQWGPDYESTMTALQAAILKMMKSQGKSEEFINEQMNRAQNSWKKVLSARDPDEVERLILD